MDSEKHASGDYHQRVALLSARTCLRHHKSSKIGGKGFVPLQISKLAMSVPAYLQQPLKKIKII